jgi:hypothetical protein
MLTSPRKVALLPFAKLWLTSAPAVAVHFGALTKWLFTVIGKIWVGPSPCPTAE